MKMYTVFADSANICLDLHTCAFLLFIGVGGMNSEYPSSSKNKQWFLFQIFTSLWHIDKKRLNKKKSKQQIKLQYSFENINLHRNIFFEQYKGIFHLYFYKYLYYIIVGK